MQRFLNKFLFLNNKVLLSASIRGGGALLFFGKFPHFYFVFHIKRTEFINFCPINHAWDV